MKPSFGSGYLDDNKTLIQHNTLHSFHVINWGYGVGHYLKIVIINIRASKNISGLINVTVTSPAGLVKFFLNVEPCDRSSSSSSSSSSRSSSSSSDRSSSSSRSLVIVISEYGNYPEVSLSLSLSTGQWFNTGTLYNTK